MGSFTFDSHPAGKGLTFTSKAVDYAGHQSPGGETLWFRRRSAMYQWEHAEIYGPRATGLFALSEAGIEMRD